MILMLPASFSDASADIVVQSQCLRSHCSKVYSHDRIRHVHESALEPTLRPPPLHQVLQFHLFTCYCHTRSLNPSQQRCPYLPIPSAPSASPPRRMICRKIVFLVQFQPVIRSPRRRIALRRRPRYIGRRRSRRSGRDGLVRLCKVDAVRSPPHAIWPGMCECRMPA